MLLRVTVWTSALGLMALGMSLALTTAQYWLWDIEAATLREMSLMTILTVGLVASTIGGPLVWIALDRQDLLGRLRDAALTDPLTGISNRRAFFEHLAGRFGPDGDLLGDLAGFSMLMIDVDRFKDLNDRLGHEAGDAALAFIAARIAHSIGRLRVEDAAFARLGGEEFAVFLPRATQSTAARVADAICADMRDAVFRHRAETIPLTVSIGAWSGPVAVGADGALALADRAAYAAKAKGRDRWEAAVDAGLGLAA